MRPALASESLLRFNTNLCLLTVARGWSNSNGALFNVISAALLIISYSSASLVVLSYVDIDVCIAGLPLVLLGRRVVIASSGLQGVKTLTWSSSPFDLTAALVHHTYLAPVPFRCMRGVSDPGIDKDAAKPSETQPSAWHAHASIQQVIVSLLGLVIACAGRAMFAMYIYRKYYEDVIALTSKSWSFSPNYLSNVIIYTIPSLRGCPCSVVDDVLRQHGSCPSTVNTRAALTGAHPEYHSR